MDELAEKFDLDFAILTRDRIELSRSGNPFDETGLWIARLKMLSLNEDLQLFGTREWDLVVCADACPWSERMGQLGRLSKGGSGSSGLMLSGLALMGQAAFSDGQVFDVSPSVDDGPVASEVDVSRRQIGEAFVIAAVVVALDEGADAGLEVAGQIVVLEQDAVLQGLVPALDLALGLGMVRRAADVSHALVDEPVGQGAGDVGRAVVAQQPWPVNDLGPIAADAFNARFNVSVTSSARMVVQSFQAMM